MNGDIENAIERTLSAVENRLANAKPLDARDWSAFFAGLVAIVKELLPVIIPLIFKPEDDEPKS